MRKETGYTLVEVIITVSLGAIIITAVSVAIFIFRDNTEYDILLNRIIESTSYAKTKAQSSKLDSSETRTSHGVKFFESRIVEFIGDSYIEGDSNNIEYEVPTGLRLSPTCSPVNNGEVSFSAIIGENENLCTVYIHRVENPTPLGSVQIGRYGVVEAN